MKFEKIEKIFLFIGTKYDTFKFREERLSNEKDLFRQSVFISIVSISYFIKTKVNSKAFTMRIPIIEPKTTLLGQK